jgi:tRNA threonylcarbamoyladenosine modification (KEOPS) complex  Pcc1 subunit
MKIIINIEDKDLIDILKFLESQEGIKIENNNIIIDKKDISKARAQMNLIFRLLKIYDNLNKFLSSL